MKVKYVEAMITKPVHDEDIERDKPDPTPTEEAMSDLRDADIWDIESKYRTMKEVFERLVAAINNHDCGERQDAFLVPVGTTFPLREQVDRLLLLPGDEVAILRLSDLQALIANQKEAAA